MSTAMTLRCRACDWSTGPVGVLPFFPDGPDQRFLRCTDCGHPEARVLEPDERVDDLPCGACGAAALVPLVSCPRCGGAVDWGPAA